MASLDSKNAGKPWTKQEDNLLDQLYNVDKLSIIEIAKIHGRAPGGIFSRLIKKSVCLDKKNIRGYEDYIKLEQSKQNQNNEKQIKPNKQIVNQQESNNEIIEINNTEYILSNNKVYEIKKVKGQIYGHYDEQTCTVKPLKSSIRKIIYYLTHISDIVGTILWIGSDLVIVKQHFPNLVFQDMSELADLIPENFQICICNSWISQIDQIKENQLEKIIEKVQIIYNLVKPNADLLIFENKSIYQNLVPILIQNNFKIIEEEPEISNKSSYIMGIKKPEIVKQCIMVLDTETTGFPNSHDPKEWEKFNSARLIELGYIIYDNFGKKIKELDCLVKPDDWIITNTFVHGITQYDVVNNGKTITEVLEDLSLDLDKVESFVCHNINFDMNIILAESYRANKEDLINKIMSKNKICTMELGKKFMKINKKPKLIELYKFLFKQEFKQEHRALSDCVACADCFYNMTC
jgi:DNA polymerase-3 subunit epsilon